jgi:hypothetical protein
MMINHAPEQNFEALWRTFHRRYPFFKLRDVDWNKQYAIYRPKVTSRTSDSALFDIFRRMLAPLNDGHVELEARIRGDRKRRYFNPERRPRFWREFSKAQIKRLFKVTERTLVANGFGRPAKTRAWMLRYCRARTWGYIGILELEGIDKRTLTRALDKIARDFDELAGVIIDIRECPGGDDSTAITIINRFADRKRIAFRRKTKNGPADDDFTPLKTWYIEPKASDARFTKPIVLLTCDTVFSGGEVFALALKQLPHVTIVGEHTLVPAREEASQRLEISSLLSGVPVR